MLPKKHALVLLVFGLHAVGVNIVPIYPHLSALLIDMVPTGLQTLVAATFILLFLITNTCVQVR